MHRVQIDPAVAGRRPLDFSDLDSRAAALLVIDMQAFFIDWPGGMTKSDSRWSSASTSSKCRREARVSARIGAGP